MTNHTMASPCRVTLLLCWAQGDTLTVPLSPVLLLLLHALLSNALKRLWEVMAGPHGDGRASDCRKRGMGWSGSIENDGHIEKASGKVQNVIGIICYSIGCIFLSSSCMRGSPEWWWSPSVEIFKPF